MFFNKLRFYSCILFLVIFTFGNIHAKEKITQNSEPLKIDLSTESKIAVVDYSILFSESKKGKQLIEKLQTKYEPMHKKIKDVSKELSDTEQKLQIDKVGLSLQEFQRESIRIKQGYELLQIDEQLFHDSRIKDEEEARKNMQGDIEVSIQTIAESLELKIVLERNSLLYASKKIDITRDVLQELNK